MPGAVVCGAEAGSAKAVWPEEAGNCTAAGSSPDNTACTDVGDFLEDSLVPHLAVDEVLLLPGKFPVRLLLKQFAAVDARREGLSGNL